jgi:diguanylate cyclase (GGDEF)-like protein
MPATETLTASGDATPAEETRLTILVVDDEVWIAEELALGLEEAGMAVKIATSAITAQAALAETADIGVVVTDIRMPGEDGLSLVRRLVMNRPETEAIETVVMTGHATIEDAVAAVRAGAFDFVRKPFTLDEMIAVVAAARARAATKRQEARTRVQEARRLAAAEAEREEALARDPLTGLPNRAAFSGRLAELAVQAAQEGDGMAVIAIDLDGFAALNEAAGSAAGDGILRGIAARLREVAGSAWFLARIGSDEFALASAHCASQADALAVAERLRAAVEEPLPNPAGPLRLTASIGVAHRSTADRVALDDAALVAGSVARREGGSRCVLFTPVMQEAAERRLTVVRDLPDAIARQETALYYQPIFNIADRSLLGFEALMRWRHPTLGFIAPGEFIAIAEESRIILDLGAWALRVAAAQAAQWGAGTSRDLYVTVNLSGRQIAEADIAGLFRQVLEAEGLPPRALVAEVTETVALGPKAAQVVEAIRALGIQVALDDFGAGYSSLGVLGGLSVDTVKLDRALVMRVVTDTRERRLLTGLVSTIHALGLKVVAEGIETEGQLQVVRQAGCEAAQGYLLGRPLTAAAATALVTGAA